MARGRGGSNTKRRMTRREARRARNGQKTQEEYTARQAPHLPAVPPMRGSIVHYRHGHARACDLAVGTLLRVRASRLLRRIRRSSFFPRAEAGRHAHASRRKGMSLACARGIPLDAGQSDAYTKRAARCVNTRRPGAVPRVSQLPRRKLKVFAPVRMVLPTGAASLLVKMTNNERYQNASQHICRHVQQELHHRHHLLSEACPAPLILQNFPAFNAAFPP